MAVIAWTFPESRGFLSNYTKNALLIKKKKILSVILWSAFVRLDIFIFSSSMLNIGCSAIWDITNRGRKENLTLLFPID